MPYLIRRDYRQTILRGVGLGTTSWLFQMEIWQHCGNLLQSIPAGKAEGRGRLKLQETLAIPLQMATVRIPDLELQYRIGDRCSAILAISNRLERFRIFESIANIVMPATAGMTIEHGCH